VNFTAEVKVKAKERIGFNYYFFDLLNNSVLFTPIVNSRIHR
jgi:hypothetical protein